jgi:hypothetical protein
VRGVVEIEVEDRELPEPGFQGGFKRLEIDGKQVGQLLMQPLTVATLVAVIRNLIHRPTLKTSSPDTVHVSRTVRPQQRTAQLFRKV